MKKHKIKLQLIELEYNNYHLIAPVLFDNGESGYWVIDTGASKTVFDLNLKQLYDADGESTDQIHTAGINDEPLQTASGIVHPFILGKLHLKNVKVALLDLAHINDYYLKTANIKICGLLGGDFLMKYNSVISFKKEKLILYS